jgi:hypothetical protein
MRKYFVPRTMFRVIHAMPVSSHPLFTKDFEKGKSVSQVKNRCAFLFIFYKENFISSIDIK